MRFRPRSVRELTQRLREKGFSSSVCDETVEVLRSRGRLDDRAFASFWVSNRLQFKPVSRRKLLSELRMKGIDEKILQECLRESPFPSEADLVRELLHKKEKRFNRKDPTSLRRLYGYLYRRGFSYETIQTALGSNE